MTDFEIGGRRFSYDTPSDEDSRESHIEILYSIRGEQSSATIEASVTSGETVERADIVDSLEGWQANNPLAKIVEFEVVESRKVASGNFVEVVDSTDVAGLEEGEPEPGVRARELSEGSRVAYYVRGPGSSVYGYMSEGVVERVLPDREHPEVEQAGCVELDVGSQEKLVPLAWVVGDATDDDIREAIDKPRPTL